MLNSVLFSLNSVHNENPTDNSVHRGYCMKIFLSICTTMRVRLRGKKHNFEEITILYGLEWKMWHAKIPIFLIAREIVLSLNKFICLL